MCAALRAPARRFLGPILNLCLLLVLPASALATWLPDGSPVCTLAGNQSSLVTVADDASGLYLVWIDARTGTSRLHAQHLDDEGAPRWAVDGVPVSITGTGSHYGHHVCTDGDGELWIAWNMGSGVYLEHLNASGQPDFYGSAPYLLSSAGYSPVCAADGAGGIIVVWCDTRSGVDEIVARRVGSGGVFDPAGSSVVGTVISDGCKLSIAANESPGAGIFLGWTDCLGSGPGLVQWVGTDLLPRWNGSAGIELPSLMGGWIQVADRQHTGGGAYALSSRAGVSSYDGLDVYSVTESGTVSVHGVDTINATERSYAAALVMDNGHGGFFCTWAVYFWPCECYEGIYAKNFDYDGSVIWGPTLAPGASYTYAGGLDAAVLTDRDRLFVSWSNSVQLKYAWLDWATGAATGNLSVPGGQSALGPRLVASDVGGTGAEMRPLVAWLDQRAGEFDIYANNLDADWPDTNVAGLYTAGDGSGVNFRWGADGILTLYLCLTDYRPTSALAGWECAVELPANAAHLATTLYGGGTNLATAPSYLVSLGSPLPPAEIMVLAEITLSITGQDSSAIYLQPLVSPCLPGQMSLVVVGDSATCRPMEWVSGAPDEPVFYLNSSPLSGLGDHAPARHRLLANHPNPFNPRTTIHYDLADPAVVDLRVYDLAGRLVCALKEGAMEGAGRHTADWNGRDGRGRPLGSGVYICRLSTGAFAESRRMVLVR